MDNYHDAYEDHHRFHHHYYYRRRHKVNENVGTPSQVFQTATNAMAK